MQGATKEHRIDLCEQVANEKDPQKVLALVKQINDLLEPKESRLAADKPLAQHTSPDASHRSARMCHGFSRTHLGS